MNTYTAVLFQARVSFHKDKGYAPLRLRTHPKDVERWEEQSPWLVQRVVRLGHIIGMEVDEDESVPEGTFFLS